MVVSVRIQCEFLVPVAAAAAPPAVPAAVAAAAAPSAAVATAAATSATPAVAAATAAGAGPLLAGLGLVDGQAPALILGAVHGRDGFVSPAGHFDEPEPAAAAGFPVRDHLCLGDRAVLPEQLLQVGLRRRKRQVPHIQILRGHVIPPRLGFFTDPTGN